MIQITPRQADILQRLMQGKTPGEITRELGLLGKAVYFNLRMMCDKGVVDKIKRGTFKPTGKEYEIIKGDGPGPKPGKKQNIELPPIQTDVGQDILEYIKGHYPLYRNKRGVLARKLGMTRTVLNQIVIEHKLGGESA